MKKVLTVKCEEGFCPLCGQELVYGTKKIMDYRGRASWECPKCKATGDEGFDAVFDGMHYNVHDVDGNEYELKRPEETETNQCRLVDNDTVRTIQSEKTRKTSYAIPGTDPKERTKGLDGW